MLGGKQVEQARVWRAPDPAPPPPSEYDFLLNGTIDRATLDRGYRLAALWDVPPHEALIATGWLSAEAYARALARHCGVGFVEPEERHRLEPASPHAKPRDCLRAGILRQRGARSRAVLAAGDMSPGALRHGLAGFDASSVALAPRPAIRAAICRAFERSFKAHAAEGLHRRDPERSAKSPLPRWVTVFLVITTVLVLAFLAVSIVDTIRVLSLVMAAVFVPIAALRVAALIHFAGQDDRAPPPVPRMPDHTLPVYTVLVPLLREAPVVRKLIEALKRLDYPALGSKRTKLADRQRSKLPQKAPAVFARRIERSSRCHGDYFDESPFVPKLSDVVIPKIGLCIQPTWLLITF